MKKAIRLTESDLYRIIKETVSILLKEEDDYKSPLQRAIDNIGIKVVGKIDLPDRKKKGPKKTTLGDIAGAEKLKGMNPVPTPENPRYIRPTRTYPSPKTPAVSKPADTTPSPVTPKASAQIDAMPSPEVPNVTNSETTPQGRTPRPRIRRPMPAEMVSPTSNNGEKFGNDKKREQDRIGSDDDTLTYIDALDLFSDWD